MNRGLRTPAAKAPGSELGGSKPAEQERKRPSHRVISFLVGLVG